MQNLKVGDKIRITKLPEIGPLNPDTLWVYQQIIARGRAVRIREIDEHGTPWYCVRLKHKDGRWGDFLIVGPHDNNWVKVKRRKK